MIIKYKWLGDMGELRMDIYKFTNWVRGETYYKLYKWWLKNCVLIGAIILMLCLFAMRLYGGY